MKIRIYINVNFKVMLIKLGIIIAIRIYEDYKKRSVAINFMQKSIGRLETKKRERKYV